MEGRVESASGCGLGGADCCSDTSFEGGNLVGSGLGLLDARRCVVAGAEPALLLTPVHDATRMLEATREGGLFVQFGCGNRWRSETGVSGWSPAR